VKRQADVVTGPNTEDGAAQAIERYIHKHETM
jgi:hydroxymethylpyrimidine pyrophosphatase-like HAD family hydrolase